MRWVVQLCAVLVLALSASAFAQAPPKRVALVIGESAYRTVSPLANPGSDARLVANALARSGFDVRLGLDLDKAALEAALDDFARDAQIADVAAVYYAGHGFENGGRNWLVPVDAAISSAADLQRAAVPFETVARSLSGAKVKIVALDACRNNPFADRTAEGGAVNRGLAEVELDGYVVLYAAAVGAVALDGVGNSPFAQAYARRVSESNVDLRLLAGRIRDDVSASTNGQQRPFISASLSGDETVLSPAPAGQVRGAAVTRERLSTYFEFVRRVADPNCFQTQTVKCISTGISLVGTRLVTFDDDSKARIWDAGGVTLRRAMELDNAHGTEVWEEGRALVTVGEHQNNGYYGVTIAPVEGGADKEAFLLYQPEGHPTLRAVAGASPRAVFSIDESCVFWVLNLSELKDSNNYGQTLKIFPWINVPDHSDDFSGDSNCGVGTVDWVFSEDRAGSDRVIAGVKNLFRGQTTGAVALLSTVTSSIVCQAPGAATDAAFNKSGGFHVATEAGPIVTYDARCRALRTDRLHQGVVSGIYPFDNENMLSRSVDGALKVWSSARGTVTRELTGLPRGARVQYVRGSKGVLILNEDKHLYIWTGEPRLGAYVGPSANVCQGLLSEDGSTLYARLCSGVVEVWRRRA